MNPYFLLISGKIILLGLFIAFNFEGISVGKHVQQSSKTPVSVAVADKHDTLPYDTVLRNIIMSEMVFVEGGTFVMGCSSPATQLCDSNEYPPHRVTLSSFYIMRYEFTNRLIAHFVAHTKAKYFYYDEERLDCPWIPAFYMDIYTAIYMLNQKTGLRFRLPTEAEWEYAARGGRLSNNYTFSGSNDLNEVAWTRDNFEGKIREVGLKKPNELGLYDMSGNVWERVLDLYDPDYYSYSDSLNPVNTKGEFQVVRGGGYLSSEPSIYTPVCRSLSPGFGWYYPPGFRLVVQP